MLDDSAKKSDQTFVDALARGEEWAWRDAMSRHGRLVLFAASRVGLSESECEEVYQNAFLSAFRAIGALRDPARLDSWLYSIAHRAALDYRAKRRHEVSVQDTPESALISEEESPDDVLNRLQEGEQVRALVAELDVKCRRLIEALYLSEPRVPYKTLSREARIPIGSIGPTRARCLEKLHKLFLGVSERPRDGSTEGSSETAPDQGQRQKRGARR